VVSVVGRVDTAVDTMADRVDAATDGRVSVVDTVDGRVGDTGDTRLGVITGGGGVVGGGRGRVMNTRWVVGGGRGSVMDTRSVVGGGRGRVMNTSVHATGGGVGSGAVGAGRRRVMSTSSVHAHGGGGAGGVVGVGSRDRGRGNDGGSIIVGGVGGTGGDRLDNDGLNLLGHDGAGGASVIVGRGRVVVNGRVLGTLLSPAPAQETSYGGGSQASQNDTGDGSSRDMLTLRRHEGSPGGGDDGVSGASAADAGGGTADDTGDARDPGGGTGQDGGAADNGRSVDDAGDAADDSGLASVVGGAVVDAGDNSAATGRRRGGKGLGTLAGAVLVGVTKGVGQTSNTATTEETLNVDRVLLRNKEKYKYSGLQCAPGCPQTTT